MSIVKSDTAWKDAADAGYIQLWGEVTEDTVATVSLALAALRKRRDVAEITLAINSNGGQAHPMWALIDALQTMPQTVTTIAEGWALSAGLMVYMAGDRRIVSPHARLLFHGGWHSINWEKSREFGEDAERAKAHDYQMAAYMAERSTKRAAFWRKAVDESREMWFTPREALEWGVAHELRGDR